MQITIEIDVTDQNGYEIALGSVLHHLEQTMMEAAADAENQGEAIVESNAHGKVKGIEYSVKTKGQINFV